MRFLIQRVTNASVTVAGEKTGEIEKGFLVFIGISENDNEQIADKMIKKLVGMRIFDDDEGKTNLGLSDVNGKLLLVSQFTLYADCKKGHRPSFIHAGAPDMSERLYEYIIKRCSEEMPNKVEKGLFGADMEVKLTNDGPFTIWLDSEKL